MNDLQFFSFQLKPVEQRTLRFLVCQYLYGKNVGNTISAKVFLDHVIVSEDVGGWLGGLRDNKFLKKTFLETIKCMEFVNPLLEARVSHISTNWEVQRLHPWDKAVLWNSLFEIEQKPWNSVPSIVADSNELTATFGNGKTSAQFTQGVIRGYTDTYLPKMLTVCVEWLKQGNLVAFPTETVFGLGAIATSQQACEKIYTIKNRPTHRPLVIHGFHTKQLLDLANLPYKGIEAVFDKLATKFWPGGLTLVVPSNHKVAPILESPIGKIALRVPNHESALQLLKAVQIPIAAPSANLYQEISPTSRYHIPSVFLENNVYLFDPAKSKKIIGVESTILELDQTAEDASITIRCLRLGAILWDDIIKAMDTLTIENIVVEYIPYDSATSVDTVPDTTEQGIFPGQDTKHYAPQAPCRQWHPDLCQTLMAKYKEFKTYQWEQAEQAKLKKSMSTDNTTLVESIIKTQPIEVPTGTVLDPLRSQAKAWNWMKGWVFLDFHKQMASVQGQFYYYVDISPDGDHNMAFSKLFQTLKKLEQIALAHNKKIGVMYVGDFSSNPDYAGLLGVDVLFDKLHKASNKEVITLKHYNQMGPYAL
jgi:tRNA threonylcarbamoyl adenosine modification protein (Sua5/YciO/YrdC/YwlC family)